MAARTAARAAGGFAARLVTVVLLAAAVTAFAEAAVAAHVAGDALRRESVARVASDARLVEGRTVLAPDRTGVGEALSSLIGNPDIRAARVVDADGIVVAVAGPDAARTPAGRPVRAADHGAAERATGGGRTGVRSSGARVTVTVPIRVAGAAMALQEDLDGGPSARRAARLRRTLVATILLGAAAVVPLTLVLGGRRLARRHADLVGVAGVDELTGLAGRAAFRTALASLPPSPDTGRSVPRPRSGPSTAALVLLDLAGWERVRDLEGHRHADALVRSAADAVREEVEALVPRGSGATVYRPAGGAFAVLLTAGAAATSPELLADRLRARVRDGAHPLRADAGTAVLGRHCHDGETLLARAEQDLVAERERRCLVEIFDTGDAVPGHRSGGAGTPWDLDRLDRS